MANIDDYDVGDIVGICPKCHHELVLREGKFGRFIGCRNYPNCKKTYQLNNFEVKEESIELAKVESARDFSEIARIMKETDSDSVRERANQVLIEKHYCSCGEKADCTRIYRTDPSHPHYLKEHHCKNCGYYITTETPNWKSFTRMGRIDDGGDDSNVTGGYWL